MEAVRIQIIILFFSSRLYGKKWTILKQNAKNLMTNLRSVTGHNLARKIA